MSQFLAHHSSGTHAGRRFLLRARGHEALRDASADRGAERLASRLRHGIDHGHALLQWRRAQEELGQGLEWPSGAATSDRLPPGLEPGARLTLVPLLLFENRLDSGTAVKCVRATVKAALEKEQRRGRERCPGLNRALSRREGTKGFPSHPLPSPPLGQYKKRIEFM